jgi:hypothetical protein
MCKRWRSADDWAIGVVCLTATHNRHDGPWIRVTAAPLPMSATSVEVERWVHLAEVKAEALCGLPGRPVATCCCKVGHVRYPRLVNAVCNLVRSRCRPLANHFNVHGGGSLTRSCSVSSASALSAAEPMASARQTAVSASL